MRGVYSEVPVGRSARAAGETIRPWQSPAHGSKHGKDSNESKPGEDQHKRHFSVIKRCSDEGNKRRLQTPSCRHLGSTQKKKHMQGFRSLLQGGRKVSRHNNQVFLAGQSNTALSWLHRSGVRTQAAQQTVFHKI